MPTIGSGENPAPANQPHRARAVAESFGVDAERYDRTRPAYPDALIARVVATAPGPDVLDVGCGTGIEARQFRDAGCTVLGVEPDPRMAGFARRSGIDVEVATIEDWDPAGRSFDAVVAGQAWHWVDPVAGAAKAAGVLRPGGVLAAFWHAFDPPAPVASALGEAMGRVLPDSPLPPTAPGRSARQAYERMCDLAADGIREAGGYAEPEYWRFDWQRHYSRDEWLDLLPTQGLLTRVPDGPRAEILDAVGTAVDALGGGFTMQYATVAVAATRAGAG